MSGQLWGTCGWCEHRKRVTRASGILYRHAWEGGECEGSGAFPVLDSVRTATVSLDKLDASWANGRSREDIVNELRELITNRTGDPDIVETYTDFELVPDDISDVALLGVEIAPYRREVEASWGWEVAYVFLWLGALAAGFAAGWWWRGR